MQPVMTLQSTGILRQQKACAEICCNGAGEISQRGKAPTTMSVDLSSIPGSHKVEEENELSEVALWLPHTRGDTPTQSYELTQSRSLEQGLLVYKAQNSWAPLPKFNSTECHIGRAGCGSSPNLRKLKMNPLFP